jgi:hypothetical protein
MKDQSTEEVGWCGSLGLMPVASSIGCIEIFFRIGDQKSAVSGIFVVVKYEEFAARNGFSP